MYQNNKFLVHNNAYKDLILWQFNFKFFKISCSIFKSSPLVILSRKGGKLTEKVALPYFKLYLNCLNVKNFSFALSLIHKVFLKNILKLI